MQGENQLRFLAREMGLTLGDVGLMIFTKKTTEIQKAAINILNEEREYEKVNDSRFDPIRRDMAENVLNDILSST